MKSKKEIIEILREILQSPHKNYGICLNYSFKSSRIGRTFAPSLLADLEFHEIHIEDWPHFSGSRDFWIPSPNPNERPGTSFRKTSNFWTGKYGMLRCDFIYWLIAQLSK